VNLHQRQHQTRGSSGSGNTGGTNSGKSSNSNLREITVSVGELVPEFVRSTRNYTLHVPHNVTEIDVSAVVDQSSAKYAVSGNTDLQIGENTVTITVTAEDGTRSTYRITVIRADKLILRLASLIIEGLDLNPEFDPDIFEYTLELTEYMKMLNITFESENENVPVEIIGDKDLDTGENTILIILKSADGSEETVYSITVTVPEKPIEEDKTEEDERKGIAGIFGKISKETWIVAFVTIITLVGVTVLIVEKCRENRVKGNNRREKKEEIENFNFGNLPGSDEAIPEDTEEKKKQRKRYV
jgi:hypothetical protein